MYFEPTVFLVEDDQAMRDSLSQLLEAEGLAVRAFADPKAFLHICPPPRPACLILDMRLPGCSGLELQKALVQQGIDLPFIMISAHGDVLMATRAMKLGAVDFIEKPFRGRVLVERVREALDRDLHSCRQHRHYQNLATRLGQLSPREQEVLERMVAGKLTKVIAAELGISVHTAETHRTKVMAKLHAQSLSELVRMWMWFQQMKRPSSRQDRS
ncbi:MAG: response regulator [Pseudomonadota bacterium]|nr:response regulator [Pseudomonadota bacterium]